MAPKMVPRHPSSQVYERYALPGGIRETKAFGEDFSAVLTGMVEWIGAGREASVDEHQERALQLKQRFLSQRPQR